MGFVKNTEEAAALMIQRFWKWISLVKVGGL